MALRAGEKRPDSQPMQGMVAWALADTRPSWSRALRKTLDSRTPPRDSPIAKTTSLSEVDVYAAAGADEVIQSHGDTLQPRQGALDLFSEDSRIGRAAFPPLAPFVTPKLSEAPWARCGPSASARRTPRRIVDEESRPKQLFWTRGSSHSIISATSRPERFQAPGQSREVWVQCSLM